MDDDLRVVDTPGTAAPADPPAAPRRGRVWLRRTGVALVVLLAAVAIGFQVQTAQVREEATAAETTQRIAERDEETARIRLDSVGDRVVVARSEETDARRVLEGSRQAMTAQGLEEASLRDERVAKATSVKDLRAQAKAVRAAIAAQKHLQPAAAACLFDLLRGLGDRSARNTEACATVGRAAAG